MNTIDCTYPQSCSHGSFLSTKRNRRFLGNHYFWVPSVKLGEHRRWSPRTWQAEVGLVCPLGDDSKLFAKGIDTTILFFCRLWSFHCLDWGFPFVPSRICWMQGHQVSHGQGLWFHWCEAWLIEPIDMTARHLDVSFSFTKLTGCQPRLWLGGQRLLFTQFTAKGIGSNPFGLDSGRLFPSKICGAPVDSQDLNDATLEDWGWMWGGWFILRYVRTHKDWNPEILTEFYANLWGLHLNFFQVSDRELSNIFLSHNMIT